MAPKPKRKAEEQTASFIVAALQRFELPRSNQSPHRVLKGWLMPRTAKP